MGNIASSLVLDNQVSTIAKPVSKTVAKHKGATKQKQIPARRATRREKKLKQTAS